MCPDKVSFFDIASESPPGSSSDDSFDEVGVVARTDVDLQFLLVLLHKFNYHIVGECDLPHEVSVVVELERWFELSSPPEEVLAFGFFFGFGFLLFRFDLNGVVLL